MKLKVSYGYTFNRGNYESERIDISIEENISDETIPEDVYELANKIFDRCKEWVWKKGGKL